MKKILALLLSLLLVMSLFVACSETENSGDNNNNATQPAPDVNSGDPADNNTKDFDLEGTWTAEVSLLDLTNDGLTITIPSSDESEESSEATEATEAETEESSEETTEPATDSTEDDINAKVSELALNTNVTYKITFTGDKYSISIDKDQYSAAVDTLADIFVEYLNVQATAEGMSLEEYFSANGTTEDGFRSDVVTAMGSPTESGTWTMDGNKLSLSKNVYTFEADGESDFILSAEGVYFYYTKA